MYERSLYKKMADKLLPVRTKRRQAVKLVYKPVKIIYQFVRDKFTVMCLHWQNYYLVTDFKINRQKGLVILTPPQGNFVAELLQQALTKINIPSEIIHERPKNGYEELPHIVICPIAFTFLPRRYVTFQMEQSISSRWFTKKYWGILAHSMAILDYSLDNIGFLQQNQVKLDKIYYLPISCTAQISGSRGPQEYDVVFYGDDHCPRRHKILSALQKEFRVKIINGRFGKELYQELGKAKIIINIYYYEGALLETNKLCECLSLNTAVVISETSPNMSEYPNLLDMVDFVEAGDVQALKSKIRYYLQNERARKNRLQHNATKTGNTLCTDFEYYFYRFLLATDNLTFEEFYKLTAGIYIKGNLWCLGLPESVDRYFDFKKNNDLGFVYFPGLRHHTAWIGCGLSYKYLLRKAESQNLPTVTICEDDVEFKDNFSERLTKAKEYLEKHPGWGIFSGVIADVAADTKILEVEQYYGETMVTIDKIVSTVYNIYDKSIFRFVGSWDNKDTNVENTIDRYIQHKSSLKYVTTIPFLVRCKNDLDSTIWADGNATYNNMIKYSEQKLRNKVKEFLETKKFK